MADRLLLVNGADRLLLTNGDFLLLASTEEPFVPGDPLPGLAIYVNNRVGATVSNFPTVHAQGA